MKQKSEFLIRMRLVLEQKKTKQNRNKFIIVYALRMKRERTGWAFIHACMHVYYFYITIELTVLFNI
jgi:hypothetical protein